MQLKKRLRTSKQENLADISCQGVLKLWRVTLGKGRLTIEMLKFILKQFGSSCRHAGPTWTYEDSP
jgi:hypothetical protein